jgi:uncharacterized membrane protein
MKWFGLAVIALAGLLALANARPASAAGIMLQFCNKSSAPIDVVVGYHSSGVNDTPNSTVLTGPFVSRGWFVYAPGECASLPNPFSARYMFWWGHQTGTLNSGSTWDAYGDDHFCIADIYGPNHVDNFTFEAQNVSETACENGHFSQNGANLWVGVREVDLEVDPRVSFGSDRRP